MEFVKLNNGTLMPCIGLGTWQLNGSRCIEIVKKALEFGYRHIDTAEIYMNELEIGRAIKNFDRKKLFITSKVWIENLTYYGVLASCEQSLSRLETGYLDQYLIHWPNKSADMNEAIKAFKALYDSGKIRSFGVSNFSINNLKETIKIANTLKIPVSANQVEFHPFLYQKELLDFCNKNSIIVTAYSPLARGNIDSYPILNEIAKKYNKTSSQISLRWLLEKNIVVIPKSSSELHLKENLDLNFRLDKKDIHRIDNIKKQVRLVNPLFAEFDD